MDPEKVPMIKRGMLNPSPNIKSIKKPRSLLVMVATAAKIMASPGERHGDATVPLKSPKIKIEKMEPPCEGMFPLFCKNLGM